MGHTKGVGRLVAEPIDMLEEGNAEGALTSACIAIAGTVKAPRGKDAKHFKEFLDENTSLISHILLPLL